MITVRIKVKDASGAVFPVRVVAENIERALQLVPGEVQFPLDPEEFFTGAPTHEEGSCGLQSIS